MLAADAEHPQPRIHQLTYLLGLRTNPAITSDDNEAARSDDGYPVRVEYAQRALWNKRMSDVHGVSTGDRQCLAEPQGTLIDVGPEVLSISDHPIAQATAARMSS
jgi:hypothetical protein